MLREIGPAFTAGRITDIALHPEHKATWHVATASGGVWQTTNAGTTWTPVFDDEGSYSIGGIALDPNDPKTVWVGRGENSSQRPVAYGDGIYKSLDGARAGQRSRRTPSMSTTMRTGSIGTTPITRSPEMTGERL